MLRQSSMLLTLIPLLTLACANTREKGPAVQVTLDDGQVLTGALATSRFALETSLGTLEFDTQDAGELGLLKESGNLQAASQPATPNPLVKLWLRNGSEFVGFWQKPKLELRLTIGQQLLTLDIPIARLARLQFRGAPVWSEEPVFRIQTRAGDDFFVDISRNTLPLQTEFAPINPLLSEIRGLQPRDEQNQNWRLTLNSGTSLNATIPQQSLGMTLAMGPKQVTIPLAQIRHMDRQQLSGPANEQSDRAQDSGSSAGGFYSNSAQKQAKASQIWTQGAR